MKYSIHHCSAFLRGFCLSCVISCAIAVPAIAETAEAFLASAHLFGRERAIVVSLGMTITERDGQSRSRVVELFMDRNDVRTRTLGRIVEPAFLAEMKFLKITERGKQDMQWMKTSRGVRRLGDSSGSESVFGSHFSVEDFGSLSSSEYTVSFVEKPVEEAEVMLLAQPVKGGKVVSRRIRIDIESRIVTGMEYLDGPGKVIKRYSVVSTAISGGVMRPSSVKMEDLVHGGSTSLQLYDFKFPDSIQERWFNPGSL